MEKILKVTPETLYEQLHKIDVIANLEDKTGIWYVENATDEYHSRMTACWPSLKEACKGLWECSDWYCQKGTGTICFREFGVKGIYIQIYSAYSCGEFGSLWV